jgi:hypothetical protein
MLVGKAGRSRNLGQRIRSKVELDGAEQMLDKLRRGGLRGKGMIHF